MTNDTHFEPSIAALEEIVKQLEKGELTLQESLKRFEEGIGLARHCQDILNKAEQKVEQLTRDEPNDPSV